MTLSNHSSMRSGLPLPMVSALSPTPPVNLPVDLYRDIHKGIRSDLFAAITGAARLDPVDTAGIDAFVEQIHSLVYLLERHAFYEDEAIHPAFARHLPDIAVVLEQHHQALGPRTDELQRLADGLRAGATDPRLELHTVHLALASFTGDYLVHLSVEESLAMPALAQVMGTEELIAIRQAIVSAMPPDYMTRTLKAMLPAMNIADRADLLGGMRQNAPAAVFNGVWDLARTLLSTADADALARRLGIA